MPGRFGSYAHYFDKILCPKCGQRGQILWEEVPAKDSIRKDIVKIDGPFYERLGRKAPHPIELVCNGCETAQPEPPLQP
jgi:hypothetical protein